MYNLKKGDEQIEYFIVDDGATIGPFTFDQIVSKIENKSIQGKSQVYKDNQWTSIKALPEFQNYLPKKKKFGVIFTLFIFSIMAIVALIFFIQNDEFINRDESKGQASDTEASFNDIEANDGKEAETADTVKAFAEEESRDVSKLDLEDILRKYFTDANNESFDAWDYYSYQVDKFNAWSNLSPNEINILIEDKIDYFYGHNVFYSIDRINRDEKKIICSFWIDYSCWRTKKQKWQSCKVNMEVIFNENLKIISWEPLLVEDLIFSDEMPFRPSPVNLKSYTDEFGKFNFVDDCYLIFTGAFANEQLCINYVKNKKNDGFLDPGYLWIPDYPSLSGKKNFATFIGIYESKRKMCSRLQKFPVTNGFIIVKKFL